MWYLQCLQQQSCVDSLALFRTFIKHVGAERNYSIFVTGGWGGYFLTKIKVDDALNYLAFFKSGVSLIVFQFAIFIRYMEFN